MNITYNVIIKRFKKQISITLTNMQIMKYTLKNVKQFNNFKIFVQNLFRYKVIVEKRNKKTIFCLFTCEIKNRKKNSLFI